MRRILLLLAYSFLSAVFILSLLYLSVMGGILLALNPGLFLDSYFIVGIMFFGACFAATVISKKDIFSISKSDVWFVMLILIIFYAIIFSGKLISGFKAGTSEPYINIASAVGYLLGTYLFLKPKKRLLSKK